MLGEGKAGEALRQVHACLRSSPDDGGWLRVQGECHLAGGEPEAAAESFGRALQLDVHDVHALDGIARALEAGGLVEPAIEAWRQVLVRDNHNVRAVDHVTRLLFKNDCLEAAVQVLRQGSDDFPNNERWRTNLAACLLQQGKLEKLEELAAEQVKSGTASSGLHLNWVRAQLYQPSSTGSSLRMAAESYTRRHTVFPPPARPPMPEVKGPLRVGILNTCLYAHNTTQHLLGWLPWIDRQRIQVHLYSGSHHSDKWTEKVASHAHCLTNIARLEDDATCQVIRSHALHALVDMNEFANNGRLGLLSRRPAPVLLHLYGNAITTGLSVLDARISDEFAEPAGPPDGFSTETVARIPGGYYCYTDPPRAC